MHCCLLQGSKPRMKPVAMFLGLALSVTGCAQLGGLLPDSALSTPITPAEVEWARKSGTNSVSGNASMASGGTSHTCAGQSANLVPDSAYARARMTAIFG